MVFFFFFQAEDGIRDSSVTGVQTCALPISVRRSRSRWTADANLATMKTLRAVAGIAAVSGLLLWWTALPAAAADVESIASYATTIQITSDGNLHVAEVIDYNFGGNHKHGIFRDI